MLLLYPIMPMEENFECNFRIFALASRSFSLLTSMHFSNTICFVFPHLTRVNVLVGFRHHLRDMGVARAIQMLHDDSSQ